jgi:radial spoke head protein 4A
LQFNAFRFFENLYVGFGQKALFENFDPAIPDEPLEEFPTGPEVIEADDPSPETEAAIRAAMRDQEGVGGEEEEDGILDDDDGGVDLDD